MSSRPQSRDLLFNNENLAINYQKCAPMPKPKLL